MQIPDVLRRSVLFEGIGEENVPLALECLGAFEHSYQKNGCIVEIGEQIREVGVLISGSANAVMETANGDRSIIDKLQPGDVFGEAIVCSGIQRSPMRLVAVSDCVVVKIGMENIINRKMTQCRFRSAIVENLLRMTSNGYVLLNRKMDILAHKSIRERVMRYLSDEMDRCASCEFCIPFNRNELADYLQVERSALSRELSRIRKEGYIDYERSNFRILETEKFERLR